MNNASLEAIFQKRTMISLKHCNYSDSIHSLRWMLSFFNLLLSK